MLPEFGHLAFIISFVMAILLFVVPFVGTLTNKPNCIALAKPLACGQALFLSISFLILLWAFYVSDFSVAYVAENANTTLPLGYRLCALWASHEGSLLLWVLLLALWTFWVSLRKGELPTIEHAQVLAILGIISAGLMFLLLKTSNPFLRLLPFAPPEGADLNPLLQDPGLVVHPPILYMGYVGFSVPFAMAIVMLISGKLEVNFIRWARPWTLSAWAFLTLGIALGSWWAYYELGWGGWWFWDPVENASFMPWLVGTALLHSLIVTEKRQALVGWTILLAISCFALSLIGTFLVRSGILTSVHAFATDPERGGYILAFLVLVIGISLLLYAIRAPKLIKGQMSHWFSRETLFLANNVLLFVACATVLLGTLYPLFIDALYGAKLSVGPPYFNAVFVPLIAPIFFLMALGPYVKWEKEAPKQVFKKLRWIGLASLSIGLILPWLITDKGQWSLIFGLSLSSWIALTTLYHAITTTKKIKASGKPAISTLPKSYWGMIFAHFGVAITVAGITLTSALDVERDVRMKLGETLPVKGYDFTFTKLEAAKGSNYQGVKAIFTVKKHGKEITTLIPEKRLYQPRQMLLSETALDPGLFRDLYVALGEEISSDTWSVRIYVKPFVRWIWLGALFMAFGGFLSMRDKRYRQKQDEPSEMIKTGEMVKI